MRLGGGAPQTWTPSSSSKEGAPGGETWVRSLGQENPLQEGMVTHSSILAWSIPWTEGPGGYSPWRRKESHMTKGLTRRQERTIREEGVKVQRDSHTPALLEGGRPEAATQHPQLRLRGAATPTARGEAWVFTLGIQLWTGTKSHLHRISISQLPRARPSAFPRSSHSFSLQAYGTDIILLCQGTRRL